MGVFCTLLCVLGQCLDTPYKLTLYNHRNLEGTTNLNCLNASLRTVFIIHGWLQSDQQPWIQQMKNAYLDHFLANVVVLDWSEDASSNTYYPSAYKVPEVGNFLGQALYILHHKNLINIKSTQLVGFSLGAHVAGYAGQVFTAKSNGNKIKTIIGLDAASSLFEYTSNERRLDANDAEFVQGFHTSDAGVKKPYATVDVYFNFKILQGCGTRQPSCPTYPGVDVPPNSLFPFLFCNHLRAVAYFIQTITSKTFLGVLCTCNNFHNKRCNATNVTVIGEHMSLNSTPGEYFLSTSCHIPFSLKYEGVIGGRSNYIC
ncbi:hypothetical protein RN001_011397 [Aquatica leii]|uniref:Lipase domain-containing protein n=1 Tax=Aquatica leii TaxID=1421715 RepID=A0AAN7PB50_9COLE|nr:hypothetical protein RN001_011397 [Aquatica leii]